MAAAERLRPGGEPGPVTAGLLRLHADRARMVEREARLRTRFAAAHPAVPTAVVPALASDVHDLDGLRRVGDLLPAADPPAASDARAGGRSDGCLTACAGLGGLEHARHEAPGDGAAAPGAHARSCRPRHPTRSGCRAPRRGTRCAPGSRRTPAWPCSARRPARRARPAAPAGTRPPVPSPLPTYVSPHPIRDRSAPNCRPRVDPRQVKVMHRYRCTVETDASAVQFCLVTMVTSPPIGSGLRSVGMAASPVLWGPHVRATDERLVRRARTRADPPRRDGRRLRGAGRRGRRSGHPVRGRRWASAPATWPDSWTTCRPSLETEPLAAAHPHPRRPTAPRIATLYDENRVNVSLKPGLADDASGDRLDRGLPLLPARRPRPEGHAARVRHQQGGRRRGPGWFVDHPADGQADPAQPGEDQEGARRRRWRTPSPASSASCATRSPSSRSTPRTGSSSAT